MGCRWKGVAVTLVAATLVASHACADSSLLVFSGNGEEPVLCIDLEKGSRFHLDFINSVYQAPVRETFEYETRAGITLVSVESPSPGVFEYYGLMTDGTGKAPLWRALGESIRLLSHDYLHHRLSAGDTSFDLRNYAVNGSPLIIRARTGNPCAAGK